MTVMEHENFSRRFASPALKAFLRRRVVELAALTGLAMTLFITVATLFYDRADPSLNTAASLPADTAYNNPLGGIGALFADLMMQGVGPAILVFLLVPLGLLCRAMIHHPARHMRLRLIAAIVGLLAMASGLALVLPALGLNITTLPAGPGGLAGHVAIGMAGSLSTTLSIPAIAVEGAGGMLAVLGLVAMIWAAALPYAHVTSAGWRRQRPTAIEDGTLVDKEPLPRKQAPDTAPDPAEQASTGIAGRIQGGLSAARVAMAGIFHRVHLRRRRGDDGPAPHIEPTFDRVQTPDPAPAPEPPAAEATPPWEPLVIDEDKMAAKPAAVQNRAAADSPPAMPTTATTANRVSQAADPARPGKRAMAEKQPQLQLGGKDGPAEDPLPPLHLLYEPKPEDYPARASEEALEQNARMLETVLEDFGIKGEITRVRPGPVVTLYELKPAPGTKSSRVIGLADDIARSMSAISARVAVVPGRDALGIELPNATREVVYLREMLASQVFEKKGGTLGLALGKDIGGEPMFADLAKMPHLLVAGTTGSGKSVAINTFILSLLYRLPPDRCRLIMIDPKMLELSIYEGIPHLLTPVVTEPRKAVVALKWAVKEMESRYKRMSELGVRNITAYNKRVDEAELQDQPISKRVQTGFDPETDMPVYEDVVLETQRMPNIVVIVDEMADLMMVAGKDIEGAIQRLAQMARAAGIHLIMATQRPSVDVITGTIKANFPTRISFQVTSKIDSRTILGEMGAEQLLGQGDMLFQPNGSKLVRVHGPFVSDEEVEEVVTYLRRTGRPDYLDAVTDDPEEDGGFDGEGGGEDADPMFDKAVEVVARTGKASTSFIQRHLKIGYNRAARIIEMMEEQGMVSAANHVGKREVLLRNPDEEM